MNLSAFDEARQQIQTLLRDSFGRFVVLEEFEEVWGEHKGAIEARVTTRRI